MNQKLSDWASIAEIVSGIAVLVTLVFLVLGIRENTEVTRAMAYDRNIDSLSEVRREIVTNSDAARLWQAFQDDDIERLEPQDSVRLRQLVFWLFGVYEKSYFANQYGVLGLSEWNRFAYQTCLQYEHVLASPSLLPGLRAILTTEFIDYIEATCGSGS
jgi:hypothetical protein